MTTLPATELFSGLSDTALENPESCPSLIECQGLVERYGDQSSAYFNLQEGVKRFGIPGLGFMSYMPVRCLGVRFNFVFANPVCDARLRPALLRAFIQRVKGRHMFVGIDHAVSEDLKKLGFRINEFGTEFKVDVASFSVAGKNKKQLRHASNLHKREELTVREQSWAEVDGDRVKEISNAWRGHKTTTARELRLLTRPPVFGDEYGVRKFYCYRGDTMLGYVFFDPYYENGKVVGYTANILRQDLDASPAGLLDFVIIEAMKQFRAEGIRDLSLGVAPLYNVQAIPGDRPLIRVTSQLLYNRGNRFYSFRALGYHKTRYRGTETKWYMATDNSSVLSVAWSILQGTGVLSIPGLAPAPA